MFSGTREHFLPPCDTYDLCSSLSASNNIYFCNLFILYGLILRSDTETIYCANHCYCSLGCDIDIPDYSRCHYINSCWFDCVCPFGYDSRHNGRCGKHLPHAACIDVTSSRVDDTMFWTAMATTSVASERTKDEGVTVKTSPEQPETIPNQPVTMPSQSSAIQTSDVRSDDRTTKAHSSSHDIAITASHHHATDGSSPPEHATEETPTKGKLKRSNG